MRVAAIDMGTNTTLLLIAEVEGDQLKKVIVDETTITRLGQEVSKTGKLQPEALMRMDSCLKNYQNLIQKYDVEKVVAVATSAARDASNSKDLFLLAEKYGILIQVIAGKKEAEISFKGSTFDESGKDGLAVIDVGGGINRSYMQSKKWFEGP